MSDKNPNPNDWNRGYTVGSGRSPVMFWLGMIFLVLFFGYMGLSYLFGG
ncbi:MAG TPA: hypothetical protein VLA05_03580 [Coriobacteriia bacterium]|nr:hypothetical protein [Coriobacteriia bacterium]